MPHLPLRRPGLIALGTAAALAMGVAAPAAAAPTGPVPPQHPVTAPLPAGGSSQSVTLITGDKVTVGTAADGTALRSVEGPNGTTASFHRAVLDGSLYVYPDAALPYVTAGVLDRQLFNVTGLIADGYDDAHSDKLPLIVRYTDTAARARTTANVAGSTAVRPLTSVQGAAVAQQRAQAPTFWSSLTGTPVPTPDAPATRRAPANPSLTNGIAKVWLDGRVTADLADSTAQIGAQRVWAEGNTATGVAVAVLDTGVDTEHPDLADQIASSASFVPDEDVTDYQGHGTHVASTIAGSGAASDGKEKGVAPGVKLHVGKVLNNEGQGQDSWIIAGMEWAARQEKARIISMSLGGGATDDTDPMTEAVNRLSAETGALFVVAAGNSGPQTIGTPGTAESALTVGSVDSNDRLADDSSQGPSVGDGGLKPEITAPGVDILAARSHLVRGGSGYYTMMSGTSMATPHVAGAAALVLAAHPDWTGQQIKQALVSSTKATPAYTPYQAGSGRVDVEAAVHATVFATASASSGFHPWPSEPGETDVKQVTYTNVGDQPVTLDLAVDATAPAGLFTLSTNRVTVPAHGTGSVTLTAKLDLLPVDQPISGMIHAKDNTGTVRAHTLIGAVREGQRQNLTVVATDRSGKPLSGKVIVTAQNLFAAVDLDASGTGTLRLPVGSYSGWLSADVQGANGPHSLGMALLPFNDVKLDKDRTVTLDGTKLRRVQAYVPKESTPAAVRLDIHRSYTDSLVESSALPNASYDSIWALPTGKKVTDGAFEFGARFRLEQPALTVATKSRTYEDLLVKRAATPLPAGTAQLPAVFAADGTPADLAKRDVRDKAVVVRRSDTIALAEQAQNAATAGAKLLLVVNDGVGRLDPWDENPWTPESPAPITVATLTADEGAELIGELRRGSVPLTVTSNPTTDYLYDVVHHWTGAVPANPTWRSTPKDLARVDVSFRNFRQGKAMEFRPDVWRGWAVGNQLTVAAQGDRTDWVTADVSWTNDAQILGETGQHLVGVAARYPVGPISKVSWFGPIQRPRMGPVNYQPVRYLDSVYIPVPGWGASGSGYVGDAGGNYDVRNWAALYQGDQQLLWGNAEYLPVSGLAPERLPYRLVVDNDRGTWANPYSTHTLTEWNFTSAATGAESTETLPLIQLDYDVATDTDGKAGRHTELSVAASHLPGVTATIREVTLELSYDDGATWQRAKLTQNDFGWSTKLKATDTAQFVTLRASAKDSSGNTVSQTLTRAFGLR
ncbi:S8 family serine peptidase [Micromonospora pisi]|nr:S8 family serine peptidase [Micromonospora pisi]